jgi:hypothetical protein
LLLLLHAKTKHFLILVLAIFVARTTRFQGGFDLNAHDLPHSGSHLFTNVYMRLATAPQTQTLTPDKAKSNAKPSRPRKAHRSVDQAGGAGILRPAGEMGNQLLFWGNIMKKLFIIASALAVSSAFATGGPEIEIDGNSVQVVAATSSVFLNAAALGDDAYAQQNVSSNSGNVEIDGDSLQLTATRNSLVANLALGEDAYASQNISSNIGKVSVDGLSVQLTALNNSAVVNMASEDTKAIQNLASNNGCVACQPK